MSLRPRTCSLVRLYLLAAQLAPAVPTTPVFEELRELRRIGGYHSPFLAGARFWREVPARFGLCWTQKLSFWARTRRLSTAREETRPEV